MSCKQNFWGLGSGQITEMGEINMQSTLATKTQYLVSELKKARDGTKRKDGKTLAALAEEYGVPHDWFINIYYAKTDIHKASVTNVERLYVALSRKELAL